MNRVATLHEIATHYDLVEVVEANIALDIQEDADVQAANDAEQEAGL